MFITQPYSEVYFFIQFGETMNWFIFFKERAGAGYLFVYIQSKEQAKLNQTFWGIRNPVSTNIFLKRRNVIEKEEAWSAHLIANLEDYICLFCLNILHSKISRPRIWVFYVYYTIFECCSVFHAASVSMFLIEIVKCFTGFSCNFFYTNKALGLTQSDRDAICMW